MVTARKKRATAANNPTTNTTAYTAAACSSHPKATLTSLPYHILHQILLYSTPPAPFIPSNATHLLNIALLSPLLSAPAISVLYRTPSTSPPARAHRLLSCLQAYPENGRLVKSLVLDIDPLLTKKTPGYGYFEVYELLRLATGLEEVWIRHNVDYPPYRLRNETTSVGWTYTPGLFEALEGRRLRAWRWNGYTLGDMTMADLTEISLRPEWQTLKRLSFIYIDKPPLESGNKGLEKVWADLLGLLPNLYELELECCDLATPQFMETLPTLVPMMRLKTLSLLNCSQLTASALAGLLLSPTCSTLEDLQVLHCRGINLSFLPALSNTPRLESIAFDGLYYSPRNSYSDTLPFYDSLLPGVERGGIMWPETLRSVALDNLRRGTAAECRVLLDSLWRAHLPWLREFEVHCILEDEGWRERADFRDVWVDRLQRRFVRPEPEMISNQVHAEKAMNLRRSQRHKYNESSDEEASKRNLKEKAHDFFDDENDEPELFPGTCDANYVDVKVDNARPMEQHFEEADFLDVGVGSIWGRAGRNTKTATKKRSSTETNGGASGNGRVKATRNSGARSVAAEAGGVKGKRTRTGGNSSNNAPVAKRRSARTKTSVVILDDDDDGDDDEVAMRDSEGDEEYVE